MATKKNKNDETIGEDEEMIIDNEQHDIAGKNENENVIDEEGWSDEEEQTITDHNFNNDIEEMDYTTTAAPTTTDNDGFTAVQNGSPNRNSIRQRQQERVNSSNPYSVLVSRSIKKNSNNNNNNSAKTDTNPTND
jgi:hypothetical protein